MRTVPRPVIGWTIGGSKLYRSEPQAYAAIARRLIEARYPMRALNPVPGQEPSALMLRMRALFGERVDRAPFVSGVLPLDERMAERLSMSFWRESAAKHTALEQRLARFLRFVDSRRTLAEQWRCFEIGYASAYEQQLERDGSMLLERAQQLRKDPR